MYNSSILQSSEISKSLKISTVATIITFPHTLHVSGRMLYLHHGNLIKVPIHFIFISFFISFLAEFNNVKKNCYNFFSMYNYCNSSLPWTIFILHNETMLHLSIPPGKIWRKYFDWPLFPFWNFAELSLSCWPGILYSSILSCRRNISFVKLYYHII